MSKDYRQAHCKPSTMKASKWQSKGSHGAPCPHLVTPSGARPLSSPREVPVRAFAATRCSPDQLAAPALATTGTSNRYANVWQHCHRKLSCIPATARQQRSGMSVCTTRSSPPDIRHFKTMTWHERPGRTSCHRSNYLWVITNTPSQCSPGGSSAISSHLSMYTIAGPSSE